MIDSYSMEKANQHIIYSNNNLNNNPNNQISRAELLNQFSKLQLEIESLKKEGEEMIINHDYKELHFLQKIIGERIAYIANQIPMEDSFDQWFDSFNKMLQCYKEKFEIQEIIIRSIIANKLEIKELINMKDFKNIRRSNNI